MTKLKAYRSKRDFDNTREPSGGSASTASGRRYVLHKHDASQLHYDLRLEQDGVLRSWALPKGPGLKAGDKRLAIEVDDHPLEYGDFEGVIPKDAYGGGTVMVWDRGEWESAGENKSDQIDFVLYGEKLKGAWTLVRMSATGRRNDNHAGNKEKNWLLIKRHDTRDHMHGAQTLAALGERSVLSHRCMDGIAAANNGGDDNGNRHIPPLDPGALDGSRRQRLPRRIRPQLATLVKTAPQGRNWLHEIKFDGYRLLARLQDERVQLLTRNNKDWAGRFPRISSALKQLPINEALLDGEAVALDKNGISDFSRLQEAISAGNTDAVVYQAFDLPHLNGCDLKQVPLSRRKQALAQLLAGDDHGDDGNTVIRYTEHATGRGRAFSRKACKLGHEGILCKRTDSEYASGRSKLWLKVKCMHSDEFVVGGFTEPGGTRTGFGSLLLGAYDDADNLVYRGRVGSGFSTRELRDLHTMLKDGERKTSPFDGKVPDTRATHWVQPTLVVEIKYTQHTRDDRLRHPVFRGLREDRNVDTVRVPPTHHKHRPERKKARHGNIAHRRSATVAGVRLTHPRRVLYPETGLTKLGLARHIESIQDWIVPMLVDRPLSLLRCPNGHEAQCFFQKHPDAAIPEHIPRVTITEKEGQNDYVYVRSIADLVGLVQAGTLELHAWGSRIDDLERPDNLIFDLDPGPGVAWQATVDVARNFRERLQELGLSSFVRTTGGKGLHLIVPLIRKIEWNEARAFAHAMARQHANTDPKHLTTNMARDKRRGRVFIDYLRNARGATAIASYSPRARKNAPVAVPIRWDELSPTLHPDRYHINNLRRRLAALRENPWAGYSAARRPITKSMLHAAGVE